MPPNDPRIARFEAMVARFPERPEPRFSLARALHDAGDHGAALPHYEQACELQADFMMAWLHRAECLLELDRLPEAAQAATKSCEFAVAQGHVGPRQEAEELLEEIADLAG